ARPAPGRREQGHQPLEAAGLSLALSRRLLPMEPLQDLVDDDPEALVDRRLLRDAKDASELVLERAGPVELDVGGGERQALSPLGQEGLQRRLVALGDQLPPP